MVSSGFSITSSFEMPDVASADSHLDGRPDNPSAEFASHSKGRADKSIRTVGVLACVRICPIARACGRTSAT